MAHTSVAWRPPGYHRPPGARSCRNHCSTRGLGSAVLRLEIRLLIGRPCPGVVFPGRCRRHANQADIALGGSLVEHRPARLLGLCRRLASKHGGQASSEWGLPRWLKLSYADPTPTSVPPLPPACPAPPPLSSVALNLGQTARVRDSLCSTSYASEAPLGHACGTAPFSPNAGHGLRPTV